MKNSFGKAREGSSLAIVICVSAFLVAFALAMIYTASLSLSRANRRLTQERSYQLARSFSEMLEEELKRYRYLPNAHKPAETDPGYDADLIAPVAGGTFYQYVVGFLEGQYGEYDPDHPDETVFHFTAGQPTGGEDVENYGESIRVALYKEAEDVPLSETTTFYNLKNQLDDIETAPIQRYLFTVEVTIELGDGSYSYQTDYQQMVSYVVEYRHEGDVIVRDSDGNWRKGTTSGEIFNGGDDAVIQYTYRTGTDYIKSCTFNNAFQGKGGAQP